MVRFLVAAARRSHGSAGLLVLVLLTCGSALARQPKWQPLNLVTPELRPKPPVTTTETKALLAKLNDLDIPFEVRGEAASSLAGSTRREVVKALRICLLKLAQSKEAKVFRAKCAAALGWSAHAGSSMATEALWKAILARGTFWRTGMATAAALLNSLGSEETLRLLSQRALEPATYEGGAGGRIYVAYQWAVTSDLHPYHSLAARADVHRDVANHLAAKLNRMRPDDLALLLDGGPCRQLVRHVLGNAPRSDLGDMLLGRLESGTPEEGSRIAELLAPSAPDEWGWEYRGFLFRLDADQLRVLWRASERLPKRAGGNLKRLVKALCYGRETEVLQGKVDVADILMDVVADLGWPRDQQHRLSPSTPAGKKRDPYDDFIYFLPWEHAARHPVRIERTLAHPWVKLVLDDSKPLWDRDVALLNLLDMHRLKAIRDPESMATPLKSAFQRAVAAAQEGRLGADQTPDHRRRFLVNMARLLVEISPDAARRQTSERVISSCDPFCAMMILHHLVDDAFARVGEGEPVWLAEQGLAVLERLRSRRDGLTEGELTRALNLATIIAASLSPEQLLVLGDTEPQGLERACETWRAWLERFKKLPVFRQVRRPSRD